MTFDCLIPLWIDKKYLAIFKIFLFSFMPLLICCLVILIRILIKALIFATKKFLKNQKKKIKNKFGVWKKLKLLFFSSIIVTFYGFYSRLIINTFILLKCISLNNSKTVFLQIDPNIECWINDGLHVNSIYFIFLPNLFIWCLGWPLFLYFVLIAKKYKEMKSIISKVSSRKKFNNFDQSKIEEVTMYDPTKNTDFIINSITHNNKHKIFPDNKKNKISVKYPSKKFLEEMKFLIF